MKHTNKRIVIYVFHVFFSYPQNVYMKELQLNENDWVALDLEKAEIVKRIKVSFKSFEKSRLEGTRTRGWL